MRLKYFIGLTAVVTTIILVRYFYASDQLLVGDQAINITFDDLKGETRSLNEFKNRFVLLTFWGSWCAPCRSSNKKLVKFYADRDTNRLKVISVGIEEDLLTWKKAIRSDSLFWVEQFTPLKMFSSKLVRDYNVYQTPTYFLINPKQRIIAKSGDIDQVIRKYDDIN